MKKSVLSLIALAIAAVSVFTSCDKNDDGYGQSAKTETQTTVQADQPTTHNLMVNVCLTDAQAKFSDMSLVLDIDGKEMTVGLSQMKQVDSNHLTNNAEQIAKAWDAKGVVSYNYDLSTFPSKKFTIKSINVTPKAVDASEFDGTKTSFALSIDFSNSCESAAIVTPVRLNGAKDIQEACDFVNRQFDTLVTKF